MKMRKADTAGRWFAVCLIVSWIVAVIAILIMLELAQKPASLFGGAG